MKSATILPILSSANEAYEEDIAIKLNSFNDEEYKYVNISINPEKKSLERTPVNICAVVDKSGSMSTIAQNGDAESQGLSVLDIVKHATKTIIYSLNERDNFSLVSYSDTASVDLELTSMDDAGKELACKTVDELIAGGQTNIWDGLYNGLESLKNGQNENNLSSIFLLTDGQPNIIPPRGHVQMMKQYFEQSQLNCSVNTFGFGYNLKSKDLLDISNEGNGQFAFIPDGSFVGTVFIHAVSNTLSTIASNLMLKVSSDNIDVIECIDYDMTVASWGFQIPIGSLIDYQSKDVIFRMPKDTQFCTRIDLDYIQTYSQLKTISNTNTQIETNEIAITNYVRTKFMQDTQQSIVKCNQGKYDEANEIITSFLTKVKQIIEDNQLNTNKYILDIILNTEGQVIEAVSRQDWFNKWGCHYLLSLINAHHLQQCNNFKDPGVQHYGNDSDLFKSIRDAAEQTFLTIQAPVPTVVASYSNVGGNSTHVQVAQPVDMSAYYNADGGCFLGSSQVIKDGNQIISVDSLKSGDKIMSLSSEGKQKCVMVNYIIKTEISKRIQMITYKGLTITNWHPIQIQGNNWMFPANIPENNKSNYILEEGSFMYNLILEEGATNAIINNIPVITLGHGIVNDNVATHNYFGSSLIIDDILAKFKKDSDNGIITIPKNVKYTRDIHTGLVSGFE